MNREFHILIRIEIIQKTYECLVSADSSFSQVLLILYKLIKEEAADELDGLDHCVVFTEDGMYCDRDVSLFSLGVRDEMIFVVY